jgi:hypothetical protein
MKAVRSLEKRGLVTVTQPNPAKDGKRHEGTAPLQYELALDWSSVVHPVGQVVHPVDHTTEDEVVHPVDDQRVTPCTTWSTPCTTVVHPVSQKDQQKDQQEGSTEKEQAPEPTIEIPREQQYVKRFERGASRGRGSAYQFTGGLKAQGTLNSTIRNFAVEADGRLLRDDALLDWIEAKAEACARWNAQRPKEKQRWSYFVYIFGDWCNDGQPGAEPERTAPYYAEWKPPPVEGPPADPEFIAELAENLERALDEMSPKPRKRITPPTPTPTEEPLPEKANAPTAGPTDEEEQAAWARAREIDARRRAEWAARDESSASAADGMREFAERMKGVRDV